MASFPRREAHQSLYDYFIEVETWLFETHNDEVRSFIQLGVDRANQRLSVTLGKGEPTLEKDKAFFSQFPEIHVSTDVRNKFAVELL